jgi:hypothetical protein
LFFERMCVINSNIREMSGTKIVKVEKSRLIFQRRRQY